MKTLILKTEGLSAYGLQTFDIHRRVNHFPTRSAVTGLLAAAMGIRRDAHDAYFALSEAVNIAVQVNNPGEKLTDYHTVQQFRSPAGKIKNSTKQTYREYRCDSEHTFAIQGDGECIEALAKAVNAPVFTLFQGRKSCPLYRPLYEKTMDEPNPASALEKLGQPGQIFSDVAGDHVVGMLQVRDRVTASPRKYAMRTVYVSGELTIREEDV